MRRTRQVRRTRSAPSSIPSGRSDLCGVALSLSRFLGVTGAPGTRLPPKGSGQPMTAAAVRRTDPVCPRRSSAACVPCRQCAHATAPLCTKCQGAPHSEACHRLRCAGVQEPGARKSLFLVDPDSSADRAQVPAPRAAAVMYPLSTHRHHRLPWERVAALHPPCTFISVSAGHKNMLCCVRRACHRSGRAPRLRVAKR